MRTGATTLIATVVIGLSVLHAEAGENKPGWLRKTFCRLTWSEIQTVAKTPSSICAAVRRHVRPKEDLGDEWATGRETWERGDGDCEDFAACIVDLCKAAGIEATTYVFFTQDSWEAHAVVMGSWEGHRWMSSNGWFEFVDSVDDAKKSVAKELGSKWLHSEIQIATPEEVNHVAVSSGLLDR